MASRNLMSPSAISLSGLLSNGIIYRVPTFQRDYSWKEDNWVALWEDIQIAISSQSDHYMGAVVVQKNGEKNFLVIDGQQRLTTLSLLTLAIIQNIQDLIEKGIEADANEMRISELRREFLGQRDAASLHYSSKLFLNENNDPFYQSHLLQLRKPANEKTLYTSDKLMWQAFQFFYNAIQAHFSKEVTGEMLATFLSKLIGDRLMFIKIEVEDELSAYTLFETLNYRGVDLTVTDLLKNYLFSKLSPIDLNLAKESWKRISASVGLDKFPTYLRHYWISQNDLVREEQMFKVIRRSITTVEDVFNLLNKLEASASFYVSLQDPYSREWQGDRERRKRIREFKLFGVKQQLPMLLIAKEKFSDNEFDRLLRLLSVIAFRYNVVGDRQANVMEDLYNKVCKKIYSKEYINAKQIFEELKSLYVSDVDFKSNFSTMEILSYGRSKKLCRYILFELENHLAGTDKDFEDDPGTIEHILPENAPDSWDIFFAPVIQQLYVFRLGNYTLLEDDKNRSCGVQLISQKKLIYHTSQYEMSRKILSPEWNPNILDNRQNQMAGWATACWKF
jgi:uncharacterized protein with ParB-like and HNH nuclease domain